MSFSPPKADKFSKMARSGQIPRPRDAHIHVGEHDWQANPDSVQRLGTEIGLPVTVVPKAVHMVPHSYVNATLQAWLGN